MYAGETVVFTACEGLYLVPYGTEAFPPPLSVATPACNTSGINDNQHSLQPHPLTSSCAVGIVVTNFRIILSFHGLSMQRQSRPPISVPLTTISGAHGSQCSDSMLAQLSAQAQPYQQLQYGGMIVAGGTITAEQGSKGSAAPAARPMQPLIWLDIRTKLTWTLRLAMLADADDVLYSVSTGALYGGAGAAVTSRQGSAYQLLTELVNVMYHAMPSRTDQCFAFAHYTALRENALKEAKALLSAVGDDVMAKAAQDGTLDALVAALLEESSATRLMGSQFDVSKFLDRQSSTIPSPPPRGDAVTGLLRVLEGASHSGGEGGKGMCVRQSLVTSLIPALQRLRRTLRPGGLLVEGLLPSTDGITPTNTSRTGSTVIREAIGRLVVSTRSAVRRPLDPLPQASILTADSDATPDETPEIARLESSCAMTTIHALGTPPPSSGAVGRTASTRDLAKSSSTDDGNNDTPPRKMNYVRRREGLSGPTSPMDSPNKASSFSYNKKRSHFPRTVAVVAAYQDQDIHEGVRVGATWSDVSSDEGKDDRPDGKGAAKRRDVGRLLQSLDEGGFGSRFVTLMRHDCSGDVGTPARTLTYDYELFADNVPQMPPYAQSHHEGGEPSWNSVVLPTLLRLPSDTPQAPAITALCSIMHDTSWGAFNLSAELRRQTVSSTAGSQDLVGYGANLAPWFHLVELLVGENAHHVRGCEIGPDSKTAVLSHGQLQATHTEAMRKMFATYPTSIVLPRRADNIDTILGCAKHRQNARMPSTSWVNLFNGATISRCSQPRVGANVKGRDDQLVCSFLNQSMYVGPSAGRHTTRLLRGPQDGPKQASHDNPRMPATKSLLPPALGGDSSDARPRGIITGDPSKVEAMGEDRLLHIFDCRSKAAATANIANGGGYEFVQNYDRARINFMGLDNIHGIRSAFEKMGRLCHSAQFPHLGLPGGGLTSSSASGSSSARSALANICGYNLGSALYTGSYHKVEVEDGEGGGASTSNPFGDGASADSTGNVKATFNTLLEGTKWPLYVQRIINAASRAALHIRKGDSVLVHCTDGWDRTAQVVCLASIMVDSHFRTIEGFCGLIQREWCEMGHRFGDRCGTTRRALGDIAAGVAEQNASLEAEELVEGQIEAVLASTYQPIDITGGKDITYSPEASPPMRPSQGGKSVISRHRSQSTVLDTTIRSMRAATLRQSLAHVENEFGISEDNEALSPPKEGFPVRRRTGGLSASDAEAAEEGSTSSRSSCGVEASDSEGSVDEDGGAHPSIDAAKKASFSAGSPQKHTATTRKATHHKKDEGSRGAHTSRKSFLGSHHFGPKLSTKEADQQSPVFMQFLDAVYQLLVSYPTYFEFTPAFLLYLLDQVYSCRFGTFLLNTHRERLISHPFSYVFKHHFDSTVSDGDGQDATTTHIATNVTSHVTVNASLSTSTSAVWGEVEELVRVERAHPHAVQPSDRLINPLFNRERHESELHSTTHPLCVGNLSTFPGSIDHTYHFWSACYCRYNAYFQEYQAQAMLLSDPSLSALEGYQHGRHLHAQHAAILQAVSADLGGLTEEARLALNRVLNAERASQHAGGGEVDVRVSTSLSSPALRIPASFATGKPFTVMANGLSDDVDAWSSLPPLRMAGVVVPYTSEDDTLDHLVAAIVGNAATYLFQQGGTPTEQHTLLVRLLKVLGCLPSASTDEPPLSPHLLHAAVVSGALTPHLKALGLLPTKVSSPSLFANRISVVDNVLMPMLTPLEASQSRNRRLYILHSLREAERATHQPIPSEFLPEGERVERELAFEAHVLRCLREDLAQAHSTAHVAEAVGAMSAGGILGAATAVGTGSRAAAKTVMNRMSAFFGGEGVPGNSSMVSMRPPKEPLRNRGATSTLPPARKVAPAPTRPQSKAPLNPVGNLNGGAERGDFLPRSLKSYCEMCIDDFTFFLRRHACRHCSRAVCGDCSSRTVVLSREEISLYEERHLLHTAHRVCDECYAALQTKRRAE